MTDQDARATFVPLRSVQASPNSTGWPFQFSRWGVVFMARRDRSTTGAGPLDFSLTERQRVNEPGQWALPVDGQSPCSKGSIRMGLLV